MRSRTTGARCSSLESEQRELSNVRDTCGDLTQRKSSKIVNQGPPFNSPVNTRLFSLFPFPGISPEKPICQPFVNLPGKRMPTR
jgi:hypothetical protein